MPSSACKKSALRSEEHTSELQSHDNLVCRLLLEKNKHHTLRWLWRGDQARGPQQPVPIAGARPRRASRARAAAAQGGVRWRAALAFFFFNDPATPELYPLPLPGALPI